MGGWGSFLGKISDQFQGRIERLKNEKGRLLDERKALIDGDPTVRATERVNAIDKRLCEINKALGNKASD